VPKALFGGHTCSSNVLDLCNRKTGMVVAPRKAELAILGKSVSALCRAFSGFRALRLTNNVPHGGSEAFSRWWGWMVFCAAKTHPKTYN
jgi:hypothetical protein